MKSNGLIESIRQRLLNLSRENGEAFDFVLARYGVERFLHRLSLSSHAGEFVLKGSMLFHVWNRRMHRPTRDLDLLGAGPANVESVRVAILDVLRTDAPDDGLVFEESTFVVAPIREDTIDGGVRAKFKAKLGNVRIPVQVDVGFGDAVVPAPEMREFTSLLSDLPGTSMPSYPVYTVIAEKFEALIRLDELNTRMKDFFDLELLLRTDPPEREILRNAIRATFERRDSEIPAGIPSGLTDRFASEKQVMWNAFLRKNGLEVVEFQEVVAAIRSGLEWIWEGRVNGLGKE